MRNFLDLIDLTADEIVQLLDQAERLKKAHASGEKTAILLGRVLGLIFEKPSLRTRVSFEAAMAQLGGASVFLAGAEAGLGTRETVPDFARVMSQYVDVVVLRTYHHATVETFARYASVPVINGLSDYYHPCQALGDLLTVREFFGDYAGRTMAFVGDANNVARSLAIICAKLGIHFILAAPQEYGFDKPYLQIYQRLKPQYPLLQCSDPLEAIKAADIIYTDVWTSMGQEAERDQRLRAFAPFQVNAALLASAPAHAQVMHCLPARRGEEITEAVLDGSRSIVIQQAGNRMHAQKALLAWLLGCDS
ncbi:MAG: ornithine carbamoyltransferase [Gemmataceae bacterium]